MEREPTYKKFLIAGLASVAIACGGSAVSKKLDGGETTAMLGLRAKKSATPLNGLIQLPNMTVESGQACVEKIELKLPKGLTCEYVGFVAQPGVVCQLEDDDDDDDSPSVEAEIKISGPFLFNLITGESSPSLADIKIPSGIYREIEFDFDGHCGLGGDTSITLNGTMTNSSSVSYPYEVRVEYDDDLELESPTDIQVLEGQTNGIFANLVIDRWFSGVNFVQCLDNGDLLPNGSGVIEINPNTNATGACEDIYDDLEDAIEDAMEFDDDDHDDDDDNDSDDDDDNDGDDD
jgi:hypothetical protein